MEENIEIQNSEEQEKREILKNGRIIRTVNIIYVRFLVLLFGFFFVLALIIPLRPKYSESEKRELKKFPRFTVSSFLSGAFFDGISGWYSDTFPLRDKFTDLNARMSLIYGKTKVKIHGTVEKGDEIPQKPQTESSASADAASSAQGAASGAETSQDSTESKTPTTETPQNTQKTQTLGALLINGDTAYEYYNFVRGTADSYAAAVSRAAALLAGKAEVYDIIAPNSMGICAPDDIAAGINTSDQKKATEYMYSCMPGVKTVPVYDTLKSRRNEYIYFRTDHHWTALGAYYAYSEFARSKGVTAKELGYFGVREFPGYLGSFYTSSGKLPGLAANPDTVYAYVPPETNEAEIHYIDGSVRAGEIISDMSTASQSSKYLTFLKGDRPLEVIRNPAVTDGSACILVKESYGNAFAPFLVPHYGTLYVVDYRYFSRIDQRGLVQLCAETGAGDVIFLNNISATRNKALVAAIDGFVR